MKILIAPNSMKGSLNAFDFAITVENALLHSKLQCTVRKVPVADGGDFTGEILRRVTGATPVKLKVTGPLHDEVEATYWISGEKAIIEMAEASGMKLVKYDKLNPMKATSFGTGQLIQDAINMGCKEIWLAIGGSATVDGGMGMMEALGFRFMDKNGRELKGNGENLKKINSLQKTNLDKTVSFKIICDVDNPLLGNNGAATVFGPQKGATTEMVKKLENGLEHWNEVLFHETGKNLSEIKGTGAAGGIATPLMAFYDANLEEGASFVLEKLNFEDHVRWADIIVTGEGKIDDQTNNLKAPFVVAQVSTKTSKTCLCFCGDERRKFIQTRLTAIYTLVEPFGNSKRRHSKIPVNCFLKKWWNFQNFC